MKYLMYSGLIAAATMTAGCKTTSGANGGSAVQATGTPNSPALIGDFADMKTPPTWEDVAAHGGQLSGYYQLESCTGYPNADHSGPAQKLGSSNFFLPGIEEPEFKGNKLVWWRTVWDGKSTILVIHNKDKMSIGSWDSQRSMWSSKARFYTVKKSASNKDDLNYTDQGDQIEFQVTEGREFSKIVLKKTDKGFHMDMIEKIGAKQNPDSFFEVPKLVDTFTSCEFLKVEKTPPSKK